MDMLQVDPKLFITCRLCLDETGLYQIIPKVQQHIKFCFDIEVEPFDGLPQLLCKKCEVILSQYVHTKQMFQEKQKSLKSREQHITEPVNGHSQLSQPPPEAVSSTQQTDDEQEIIKGLILPNNSLVCNNNEHDQKNDDYVYQVKKSTTTHNNSWRSNFFKKFACKFCSETFKHSRGLKIHLEGHNRVFAKYNSVIRTSCFVKMERCEKTLNFTGSMKYVVLNSEQVVQHNKKYAILFSRKNNETLNDTITTVSSDEDGPITNKRSRRQRINSKNSDDTVVIEGNYPKTYFQYDKENKCDELVLNNYVTDSESITSEKKCTKTIINRNSNVFDTDYENESNNSCVIDNSALGDISFKTSKQCNNLENVITKKTKKCYKNFLPKLNLILKESIEKKLQHKVLSMGQKILNVNGFNCTGLLRYLEYKNLEVIFILKSLERLLSDSKHARIQIKSKVKNKIKHNADWNNVNTIKNIDNVTEFGDLLKKALPTEAYYNKLPEFTLSRDHFGTLYKLLNANPVANPKQFPNINTLEANNKTNQQSTSESNNRENHKISSSTSLAESEKKHDVCTTEGLTNDVTNLNNIAMIQNTNTSQKTDQNHIPRLKVKPVSELMPLQCQTVANNKIWLTAHQAYNVAPQNAFSLYSNPISQTNVPNIIARNFNKLPYCASTATGPSTKPLQPIQVYSYSNKKGKESQPSEMKQNEYILLTTSELPNTRTKSPLEYLRTLLQNHNITLLECKSIERPQSSRIITFKLRLQQENTLPMTLCIALFGDSKTIRIKVNNDDNVDIDIMNMSSQWQWEIIKIFKKEIGDNALANSLKYDKATQVTIKTFVALVRSIQCPNEMSNLDIC